ncbi:hypothetical protein B7P43_G01348 [Cryptotermes secundus]|uniref:Uncharacterized protein n=1 Tax=Cryptotermes secundus TaxID=105785 RepID=A0A2J7RE71_9NEOP|nr:uncharacterized protein LOC111861664 [Cryptotermes secundus]PNF39129.1 hypothetical protein B7P43_G01348 [Cryptotermes secundus]
MKSIAILIAAIAVLACSVSTASVQELQERNSAEIRERIRSAANVFVDAVVERLRKYALEHSLEPLAVPDLTRKFTVTIFGAEAEGFLYLTNGWLRDLITLLRSGEADVEFVGDLVHISTDLVFERLHLDYDFRVSVFGLQPSGELLGRAEGLRIAVVLNADLTTFRTTLSRFTVVGAKNIAVEAVGGGLPSDLLNTLIDLVKPYIQDDILSFIEEKMKSTLEDALVDFDISEIIDL